MYIHTVELRGCIIIDHYRSVTKNGITLFLMYVSLHILALII